jgi:hypothetical protein
MEILAGTFKAKYEERCCNANMVKGFIILI